MSTLTTTRTHVAAAEAEARTPRKGFLHRAYEAIVAAQQRRAEREIARYIEIHGGLMTDDMEREMMDRFTGRARRGLL